MTEETFRRLRRYIYWMWFEVSPMLTMVVLAALILLVALAAADLWVASMSSDEIAQMGLET